jgi:hypothetical protein
MSSFVGLGYLQSRTLVDEFKAQGDVLVRHYAAQDRGALPAAHRDDATDEGELAEFAPDLIFAERGFEVGSDQWRLPADWLDSYVRGGGCLIVDGLDASKLANGAIPRMADFWNWARCWPNRTHTRDQRFDIPMLIDRQSNAGHEGSVVCRPSKMFIDDWASEALKGVESVQVDAPVALDCSTVIASVEATADLVVLDTFVDSGFQYAWASTHRIGAGLVTAICGTTAADKVIAKSPGNLRWLQQLSGLMLSEAEVELRVRGEVPASVESSVEDLAVEWKAGIDVPEMHDRVVKSLAGFANAEGGDLHLGVDDSGRVLGIDESLATTPKGEDGYRRRVLDLAQGRAGAVLPTLLRITFDRRDEGTVCHVRVLRSSDPIWITKEGVLPVRVDGKTMPLKGADAFDYIRRRFPRY